MLQQIPFFILFSLSTLGYILFFSERFQWKIEVIPLSVILAQTLFLYIASLLNNLLTAVYGLLGSGMILLVYFVFSHRRNLPAALSRYATPGFFLFWLFVLIFSYSTRNITFINYDEFSHWGLLYKLLYASNKLPGQESLLIFPDYPPGTAIYEYYVARIIGFREGSAYFALNLMVISSIIATISCVQWAKWLREAVGFATIFLFVYYLGYKINVITVDLLLGVLFGAGMVTWLVREDDRFQSLIPTILICSILPLVKTTGILFATAISFVIIADHFQLFQIGKVFHRNTSPPAFTSTRVQAIRKFLFLLLYTFGIPLVFFLSWNFHFLSLGFPRHFSPETNFQKIRTSFSTSATPTDKKIIATFLDAVNSRPLGISAFSVKNLLVFYSLALAYCYFVNLKDERAERAKFLQIHLLIFLCALVYLIMLLFVYLYSFTEYEGLRIASFERYAGSFFLGWGIIIYSTFLFSPRNSSQPCQIFRKLHFGIAALIFIYLFLAVPLSDYSNVTTTGSERQAVRRIAKEFSPEMEAQARVYDIWQNTRSGYNHLVMRYELAPRFSQYKGWSLGEPYGEEDIWTVNIDPEEWLELLHRQKYDYVLVSKPDDQFWKTYGTLFDGFDWNNQAQLFRVTEKRLVRMK